MNNTTHGNPSPLVQYPPMVQATIEGPSVESSDSEAFGHNFPTSPSTNTTIITYQNIGPQTETIRSRAHHNARAFKSSNAGISLISEHGLNHYKIRNGHQYNDRMRTVDKTSYSYISHNANEAQDFGWKQYGGMGFTCTNILKSNKTGHGCDPAGLSRWTWARFKGKADSTVITVSAYRPCIQLANGLSPTKKLRTVGKQHTHYYQAKDNILEPDILALFDRALLDAVKTWLDIGDSVVLGIDMNDDVRMSTLTKGL